MKIDWTSLTPAEIYESLRSAPKVAGPWQPTSRVGAHFIMWPCRRTPEGRVVMEDRNGEIVVHGWALAFGSTVFCFTSRDLAELTLSGKGWLFVD